MKEVPDNHPHKITMLGFVYHHLDWKHTRRLNANKSISDHETKILEMIEQMTPLAVTTAKNVEYSKNRARAIRLKTTPKLRLVLRVSMS